MECLFAILQVCLFDPSAITITADMSWQGDGRTRYLVGGEPYTGSVGRLDLTVHVPISREFSVRYGIEHRSMFETGRDRGEERWLIGATWTPFARQ